MAEKRQRKSQEAEGENSAPILAKKAFTIHHNEHHIEIKEGDDVSGVPAMFVDNLKTEGVI